MTFFDITNDEQKYEFKSIKQENESNYKINNIQVINDTCCPIFFLE